MNINEIVAVTLEIGMALTTLTLELKWPLPCSYYIDRNVATVKVTKVDLTCQCILFETTTNSDAMDRSIRFRDPQTLKLTTSFEVAGKTRSPCLESKRWICRTQDTRLPMV